MPRTKIDIESRFTLKVLVVLSKDYQGSLSRRLDTPLTGGDFWKGAATGATIDYLNHAMHQSVAGEEDKTITQTEGDKENKYIDIGIEFTFSFGLQLGLEGSVFDFSFGIWGQTPSVQTTIRPYLRYTKEEGFSVGVEDKTVNISKAAGHSFAFYDKQSTITI